MQKKESKMHNRDIPNGISLLCRNYPNRLRNAQTMQFFIATAPYANKIIMTPPIIITTTAQIPVTKGIYDLYLVNCKMVITNGVHAINSTTTDTILSANSCMINSKIKME